MAKYVEETHPVDDQNLSFLQQLEQPVDLNILLEDRQSSEIYNGEIGSFEEFDKVAFCFYRSCAKVALSLGHE